jgi:YVTN family beta-propeller protein
MFTQERGDEAAAKLAAKFARIAREEIDERGGSVIELRGDEALAVFASPRQAVRAALALQERFVDETLADPEIPLLVGIGLDAGEAVPVEGGYRGGALNLAARMCGQAGPGQILASREVTHLARRLDGVRYIDQGAHSFKGLTEPVGVIRIEPEEGGAESRLRPPVPTKPERRWIPRTTRGRIVAAAVALCLVAAAVTAGVAILGGTDLSIGPSAIGLIDPAAGSVVERADIAAGRGGMVFGAGAVWAAGSRPATLLRIDPDTRAVVDTVEIGGEASGVAVADGFVWVSLGDEGRVERINPSTNAVVGSPIRVGNGPAGIAAGFGSLWVANRLDATVSRIDLKTDAVQDRISVGATPTGVVAAAGSVWVTNAADGTVTRIDPISGAKNPVGVGNGPTAIAGSDQAVWVVNASDATVSRIDPDGNTVTATIEVGAGPVAIGVTAEDVWVASEFSATVSRIDPASNGVAGIVDVGAGPHALAVVGGQVWVATSAAADARRGGTFTYVSEGSPDSIDPAYAYSVDSWAVLVATNDGLVGYRKVGGQDGSVLVPDLTTSLPEPTDGGRTYAFTLRRDIAYSSGGVVRARDVRASIERVLRARPASPGAVFFETIVGADGCAGDPAACDLSRGIVTNDETGSVTFHLSRPDPDFLYKLSIPFASVLPSDVRPADLDSTDPLPATGPYVIAEYTPPEGEGEDRTEGRLELERNPRFREWSGAAQPEGNPDRIVRRIGVDPDTMVDLVRDGGADWMVESPNPDRLEELRTRYAERLHEYPQPSTLAFAMNTRVPPFDDVNVRRAVNLALDRRVAAAFFGEARITCQILPPNFPGYRPYCPYSFDTDDDAEWSAPDLARARRLVNASGYAGTKVTVWTMAHPPPYDFEGLGKHIGDLLRELGFQTTVRVTKEVGRHFELVANSRTRAQIFGVGWFQDYAAASNFLDLLFSCGVFVPNEPFQTNYSQLCDPEIDRLIDRAYELQVSDPSAAGEAWAAVDRAVVDAAAWLPIANPAAFDFLSERVGNYHHHPQWGLLISQVTVR